MRIDVIIPVYRGFEETRRCIESVLMHTPETEREVIIVNDASPEAALADYVSNLARYGRVTLLTNAENRGFVASVNRAMALHQDRDVVLLNSDTEVHGDWLGRLAACAARHDDTGTVTAFSNNATIASYPRFCSNKALPEGASLSAMD